jgi:formate dehydrogenase iron-sulfur subunit
MTAWRVYVPSDTAAASVGADDVAAAVQEWAARHVDAELQLVRNGSRGAAWLEPLVEIDTAKGRVGFSRLSSADVPALLDLLHAERDSQDLPGQSHAHGIGLVEDHPWFRMQRRLMFSRVGRIDPLSLDEYRDTGGLHGLQRALQLEQPAIVQEVIDSGLRGRGGAAFPTGIKWRTVQQTAAATRYVVCNADEGDSGTFADRLIMEADPFRLMEGMIIAGLAVGAQQGYVYLRSEYPRTIRTFKAALHRAREAGLLGSRVLDTPHAFDIALRVGAGAYICGEETALLESLEGRRGQVRSKPPLPAVEGLFGCPTVINNVLTLAAVPDVLAQGATHYAGFGVDRSRGTMPFQLAGNVAQGGLVELPFGITLRELLETFAGGTRSGRALRAVQVGGPLGAYLPASQWDTPLSYEHFAGIGAMLGHGGIVLFDDSVNLGAMAQFAMEFCAIESCGKCTPCRIGSTRGVEVIAKLRRGENVRANWELLGELCETMEFGSLCAMGGLTPLPVRSIMTHFTADLLTSASTAAELTIQESVTQEVA